MSSTAVLMPSGITDEWRARARVYVEQWYRRHFEHAELITGECPPGSEWSKGEAIADAFSRTSAEVLVLADADSFMLDPGHLRVALDLVQHAGHSFAVPHSKVYRLRADETTRIENAPELAPRLGYTARPVYEIGRAHV